MQLDLPIANLIYLNGVSDALLQAPKSLGVRLDVHCKFGCLVDPCWQHTALIHCLNKLLS